MEEYARSGAVIQEDLSEASVILGVKQVRQNWKAVNDIEYNQWHSPIHVNRKTFCYT
jgi:hypothetical protein